ncbi:MAG: hypothetical protein FJZ89_06865 [Chloroflexi bacterium]|nr:hypothetical protein [Chloroflexota bacterium]
MGNKIDLRNWATDASFPAYLASYESLEQHFRGQLDGLSPTGKGDRFAHFVQRLVPQTDVGSDFDLPVLREKKSGDEGVDLIASGKDGRSVLYIQAKMWIDRAEDIDSIISKFQAYLTTHSLIGQQYSFGFEDRPTYFLVVTLSSLKGILDRYEKRKFASEDFYRRCVTEHRIHFVDGHQILSILRAAYSKISQLPANLVLNLETPFIRKDNVFFGVISSTELRALYKQFGDALFFENIRDFLGPAKGRERMGRTTPNDEIITTITTCPDKMLERNNGIVFRADEIKPVETQNQLILTRGSVVNGCQTTMCMVEYAEGVCYVPVKVVQTTDSWDIAKAANYQNSVADIDLDLARHLRPQLAKRAAAISGFQIEDGEKSAFQIIDAIYDHRVAYDETRLLYIGLFSKTPNNVFTANYTELMTGLIERFYQEDPYWAKTFETLFMLQGASQEGLEEAKETFKHPEYAGMFERLYREDSLSYKCFISILALCGAVDINIAKRESDLAVEHERMKKFLSDALVTLQNYRDKFLRYYTLAVKI